MHPSCNIHKGICSCGGTYIVKTIRNNEEGWSQPAKHVPDNEEHSFSWSILIVAPKESKTRENLEALIKTIRQVNRQDNFNLLTLFSDSVT